MINTTAWAAFTHAFLTLNVKAGDYKDVLQSIYWPLLRDWRSDGAGKLHKKVFQDYSVFLPDSRFKGPFQSMLSTPNLQWMTKTLNLNFTDETNNVNSQCVKLQHLHNHTFCWEGFFFNRTNDAGGLRKCIISAISISFTSQSPSLITMTSKTTTQRVLLYFWCLFLHIIITVQYRPIWYKFLQ